MAQSELAIVREYVECWLDQLSGDLSMTPEAEKDMARHDVDLADLVTVIRNCSAGQVSKEEAHHASFELAGRTDDGAIFSVTMSLEINNRGLCVHRVRPL